jgi:hypothetical protein
MQFATNTEYAPVFVCAGNVATIWVSLNGTSRQRRAIQQNSGRLRRWLERGTGKEAIPPSFPWISRTKPTHRPESILSVGRAALTPFKRGPSPARARPDDADWMTNHSMGSSGARLRDHDLKNIGVPRHTFPLRPSATIGTIAVPAARRSVFRPLWGSSHLRGRSQPQ